MFKKFFCLLLSCLLLAIPFAGCGGSKPGGNGSNGGNPSGGGDDGPDKPATLWNKEPTVKDTFYEDFSNGVNADIWEVSRQKWGAGNNGTSPDNVFYSKNKSVVEGADATGGVVAMRSLGDLQKDANKRRQGSALISRRFFGPGKYEVRMKVVPRMGPCTAMWTYYNGGGDTAATNKYSEIDIEMPINGTLKKWAGTSYERFIDWNILADRQTVTVEDEKGVNDGEWHVYAFEWRTDKENKDCAVYWYKDGVKMAEAREYVPHYTAAFWVGNWFPDDKSWVGVADFEEAYMYVDWIKITEYNDPVKHEGQSSSARAEAVDLGNRPLPQVEYIANGQFLNTENGELLGWAKTKGGYILGTENEKSYVELNEATLLRQPVSSQFPGYKFRLSAEALSVTGAGKCTVYVQYMMGSVARGSSQKIEFTADGIGAKNIEFTVGTGATDVRVVIETEAGTIAKITNVKMAKIG